jgi:hypothetical protein
VLHEANIAVRHHCLDFQMTIERHDREQRLGRGDYTTDCMHGELLTTPSTGAVSATKTIRGLDQA